MGYSDEQKLIFATYILTGEAEHWWEGTRRILEAEETEITWELFITQFLDKYFNEDLKHAKELEFLDLK